MSARAVLALLLSATFATSHLQVAAQQPPAQAVLRMASDDAASPPNNDAGEPVEFVYRAQRGDSLIALSRRLLIDASRWRELQTRNRIADPLRIPLGSAIRVPYGWLKLSTQPATIIALTGQARVDGRPVTSGEQIGEGAEIVTEADGFVTLRLGDGTLLTLQRESVLRLRRLKRVDGAGAHEAVLDLQRGKLETKVAPQRDMGRFEIRTPAAVSAVRGTTLRAGTSDDGRATTETLEGLVAVRSGGAGVSAGGATTGSVAVAAGFGTRVERGAAPIPPVALLPAPDLSGVPRTHDRSALRWRFEPLAGATAYRHQLARDAEFRAILLDSVSTTPEAQVPALAAGQYWLRSRGIDANGLEGLDAALEVRQQPRPEPPAPLEPAAGAKLGEEGLRFRWAAESTSGAAAAAESIAAYRFQLARDPQFNDLVEERSDLGRAEFARATLPAGTYWWRVAALGEPGASSGHWSEGRSFVQRRAPAQPNASPVAGRRGAATFAWTAGADETAWEWQIARSASFDETLRSERSSTPAASVEALPAGRYWFRVRALDAAGDPGPYSEARSLSVPPPWWTWLIPPALLAIAAL